MKYTSKFILISFALLITSCFSDSITEDANQPVIPEVEEAGLTVRATRATTPTPGRLQAFNDNVQISSFMINIARIEFEFADGFGEGIYSPSVSDIMLSFEQLPQAIKDYLEANYPNDPFCKAEMEEEDDEPYLYEVELVSGTEIYFREDFTIYAIDIDDDGCELDDDEDDEDDDSDNDFKVFGPFEIDLTNETTTITEINIPIAEYEEVEFEMERSTNPNSPLFQKSILMTGTINGQNFEFYHTFSEDFEVDYEDQGQNLVITEGNNNQVTFQFDLISVVNSVDFSSASDGNENGLIEISPIDADGNNQLAHSLRNAIKVYVDLID